MNAELALFLAFGMSLLVLICAVWAVALLRKIVSLLASPLPQTDGPSAYSYAPQPIPAAPAPPIARVHRLQHDGVWSEAEHVIEGSPLYSKLRHTKGVKMLLSNGKWEDE